MEDTQVALEASPRSLGRKILSFLGWSFIGILFLTFFTFFKLPQDRIRNLIQANVNSALTPRGATFAFDEGALTIGFGISYVLKGITLTFPDADSPYHIDRLELSPSLISLITGKMGGSLSLENKGGSLSGSFSFKNGLINLSFNAKNLDLAKLGVFAFAGGASIKANASLSGNGEINGDFSVPSSLEGMMNLRFDHLGLDQQTLGGFSIPRISVSEGILNVTIEHGKAVIKTVKLGKSAEDDIQATVTGEFVLTRSWDSCTMNLKTRFGFSSTVSKAFVILDAMLAPGKQTDGSYAYQLTGPVGGAVPMPLPAGSS